MNDFKLPRKINIFGTDYKVKTTKNLTNEGEHVAGLCHKDTKLIEIDKDTKQKELKAVFMHEVFHGVVEELSLGEIIDGQLEEIICEAIPKMVQKIEDQQVYYKKKAAVAKKKKAPAKRSKKSKTKRKYRR